MSPTTANFDRLAPTYRVLEYLAFGRVLQHARAVLLPHLSSCGNVLLVGDGDGRCLEALGRLAPNARVTSVDASGAMIELSRRRVAKSGFASRVTFVQTDVRSWPCPPRRFDAIVTMFFLDCFTAADVDAIVASLTPGLQTGGRWLFVDFAIPGAGLARLYARLLVKTLYAFFRSQTHIEAHALPPAEAILEHHGFRPRVVREFRAGLVRCVLLVHQTTRPILPSK
jgi:ubiquinone/menaquinone biosynthesis C-methylase UbiE